MRTLATHAVRSPASGGAKRKRSDARGESGDLVAGDRPTFVQRRERTAAASPSRVADAGTYVPTTPDTNQ